MTRGILTVLSVMLAIMMLGISASAQQDGAAQEAADRMSEASMLLDGMKSMDLQSPEARALVDQASASYDDGVASYNDQDWQSAIDSFTHAVDLCNQADRAENNYTDAQGPVDIPWSGNIDPGAIGQGLGAGDVIILLAVVLSSLLVVLPVTYRLV